MFRYIMMLLPLFLNAQILSINDLRTNLYSKNDTQNLKKIEISLEIQTDTNISKAKVIDAVNVIISSFFYEDIFTEIGKLNFKQTLEKFIEKKYKVKVDDVYILSLNSVENFDLEEFKKFIKDNDKKEKTLDENKTNINKINLENNIINSNIDNNTSKLKDLNKTKEQNQTKEEIGFDIKLSDENETTSKANIQDLNDSLKQLEDFIKDLNNTKK